MTPETEMLTKTLAISICYAVWCLVNVGWCCLIAWKVFRLSLRLEDVSTLWDCDQFKADWVSRRLMGIFLLMGVGGIANFLQALWFLAHLCENPATSLNLLFISGSIWLGQRMTDMWYEHVESLEKNKTLKIGG